MSQLRKVAFRPGLLANFLLLVCVAGSSYCSRKISFDELPLGLTPDTELVAQSGQREKLLGQLKQVNLLFFGFTRCPDFCPMTLHRLQSAVGDNVELREKFSLLFISVDVKTDTPAELARYLEKFPYARGYTGTADEVQRIERLFGAYSKSDHGAISHSLYLYVLNEQGKVIHLVRHDEPIEKLRQILKQAGKYVETETARTARDRFEGEKP